MNILQIARVHKGNYAYITSQTKIEMEMSLSCAVDVMTEKLGTFNKGIGVQTNSVYKDLFSNQ